VRIYFACKYKIIKVDFFTSSSYFLTLRIMIQFGRSAFMDFKKRYLNPK
jgi:hypothetical protein